MREIREFVFSILGKNMVPHQLNRMQKRNILEPRKLRGPAVTNFAPIVFERAPAKTYLAEETKRYGGK